MQYSTAIFQRLFLHPVYPIEAPKIRDKDFLGVWSTVRIRSQCHHIYWQTRNWSASESWPRCGNGTHGALLWIWSWGGDRQLFHIAQVSLVTTARNLNTARHYSLSQERNSGRLAQQKETSYLFSFCFRSRKQSYTCLLHPKKEQKCNNAQLFPFWQTDNTCNG